MKKSPTLSQDVEALVGLGQRFTEAERYEEATELFLLALDLDPANMGVKLALAEVRKLAGQAKGSPMPGLRESLREEHRRNAIDAAHFIGLAHVYAAKGEDGRAIECLEVAADRQPASPSHHKLLGRILFRRRELDAAAEELQQALRFNPFDREVAESLGRVEYERKRFEAALKATVHAFLLLNDGDEEGVGRLRRRIKTIKQVLGLGNRELSAIFRERQESLHVSLDRLEWHRERFIEELDLTREAGTPEAAGKRRPAGQIALASRLRALEHWSHLSDEQLFVLTRAVEEEIHRSGSQLFAHGSLGRDLYVLESGEISIRRTTSYGSFALGTIQPGQLFGEVNYLTRVERSGDAQTTRTSHLLRFDAETLDRLIEENPELGVQVYWTFWHGLARKLRDTNEKLRSFFDPSEETESFLRLRRPAVPPTVAGRVKVESSDKIRLFREQGLSRKELMTLATFSREKHFPAGAAIFQEGDEGDEMYVVLEGRVRISKFIPGAGEEALAILGRGDFFGEMALIDGSPRSADARAHNAAVTVLALDEATVQEILSMDAEASLEFLALLCRLITNRLREIDEKVVGWHILSGGDPQSALA